MKKSINIMLMVCCLFIGGVIGHIEKIEPVQAEENYSRAWSSSENNSINNYDSLKRGEKLEIEYTEYRTPKEYIIEFNNGSFIYVNEEKNIYSFTPVELGDWDYNVNSLQELEKLVQTYKSIYETGYY